MILASENMVLLSFTKLLIGLILQCFMWSLRLLQGASQVIAASAQMPPVPFIKQKLFVSFS